MPIVHIHSPIQSIEMASMEQAAQLPVPWFLENLAANAAQATILPPGFADDITLRVLQKSQAWPSRNF